MIGCDSKDEPMKPSLEFKVNDSTYYTTTIDAFNTIDPTIISKKHVDFTSQYITLHFDSPESYSDSERVVYFLFVDDSSSFVSFSSLSDDAYQTMIPSGIPTPMKKTKGTYYAFFADGFSGNYTQPAYFSITPHNSTFDPSLSSDTITLSPNSILHFTKSVTIPSSEWYLSDQKNLSLSFELQESEPLGVIWNPERRYIKWQASSIPAIYPLERQAGDLEFLFFDFSNLHK